MKAWAWLFENSVEYRFWFYSRGHYQFGSDMQQSTSDEIYGGTLTERIIRYNISKGMKTLDEGFRERA